MTSPFKVTRSQTAGTAGAARGVCRTLVVSSTFPSAQQPIHGTFVKERVKHVARLDDVDAKVVSPVPYFPPLPQFARWYPLSQISRREWIDSLEVRRPRYFLPPKVGAFVHPQLMHLGARATVDRWFDEEGFDLIDGHFIYPDGVAAVMLAERYRLPVVLTGRGEEILRFPGLPLMGRAIRWGLQRATRLIALSDEIAEAMRREGADGDKIRVIPNGVDCERFRPLNRNHARRRLGLPLDRPVVVSVGYRLERKGFHLLVDAVPRIRERFPNVLVVIVGGPARWGEDYTGVIEGRIRQQGLAHHVELFGARPPGELPDWYSAADLFALLTSREGSPNVLLEALACGLPVVATPIADIPKILADRRLGVLLEQRSAGAAAAGIVAALETKWDPMAIREHALKHSWQATAQQVREVFRDALAEHRRMAPLNL